MAVALSACSFNTPVAPTITTAPTSTNSPQPSATATPIPPTLTETPLPPTATLIPSATFTPAASPTPPGAFLANRLLRTGVEAQAYLPYTCQYLQSRWDPAKSAPGTVVVPIMFHGIVKTGGTVTQAVDIPEEQFQDFVTYAHYLGYETITTAQLVDFLHNNAKIPPLSMMLILDDRRPGTVRQHFLPVLEQYNWTVTLGYISGTPPDSEWKEMEDLASSGRLDVQAHGYLHNGSTYIVDSTPEDVIRQEIFDPIPVLQAHFGYRPTAFIWPGGNFTAKAVKMTREAGYQVGFTIFSRGPLLYNWVPQGEEERAVGDPLMTLPRFWSRDAGLALDIGVKAQEQAQAFAKANFDAEAAWYREACGGELLK